MAHEALIACFRATNQLTEAERIETQFVDYTKKNPPPATVVTLEFVSQPPAAFEDFRQNFFALATKLQKCRRGLRALME